MMNISYLQSILTASFGGILYGYDMGVISGALPLLSAYFQLTPSQEEWIVSLLYFGGGVGAASGGIVCDRFGRKFCILFTDAVFGVGALLLYNAETVETVMVGRFVLGWAVAVSGIADVAYLHEISSVWDEGGDACEGDNIRTEGDRPVEGAGAVIAVVATTSDDEGGDSHGTGSRGSVVSVNEACISLGFLLAYAAAYSFGCHSQNVLNGVDGQASDAWRRMFAFGGFLAAVQFVGMLCMPESPVWLHEKGRMNEAVCARCRIRGTSACFTSNDRANGNRSVETSSPYTKKQSGRDGSLSIGNEMNASSDASLEHHSSSFTQEEQIDTPTCNSRVMEYLIYVFMSIRSIPSRIHAQYHQVVQEIVSPHKKQCAIALFLATSQQLCGHISVLNFSAEIFAMLSNRSSYRDTTANLRNGVNSDNNQKDMTAIELTIGIGVLKFLMTCIVILFVEKGGRRGWLISGMSLILLSLTFLCVAFVDSDDEDIEYGSDNPSLSLKNSLGIVGIYGIAVGYAASFGPLTWLVTSELFPSSVRGRALGFATVATYMAAGLVSRTFLSLQEGVGLAACFAVYWTATIVSIVLVWLGIPDTGGEKTPEEIDTELKNLWIWGGSQHRGSSRRLGRCPLFLWWKSKRGERPSDTVYSPTFRGSYGSSATSSVDDRGVSKDSSMNGDNAAISSGTVV